MNKIDTNIYLNTKDSSILKQNTKLLNQLKEELKNTSVLNDTWFNNFNSFIDNNKSIVDFDKLYEFLDDLFDGKYKDKYKTISIIKDNITIKYNDYRSVSYSILLREYNYSIIDGNIFDKDNNVVDNESAYEKVLGNIEDKLLKDKLFSDGEISSEYKKNKYLYLISSLNQDKRVNRMGNVR